MNRIKGLPVDGEAIISEAEQEKQDNRGIPSDKVPCGNSDYNEN